MEDFETVHRQMLPKLQRWAHKRIPGLTEAEVLVEMEQVLWHAHKTFNGYGRLDGWFARCWSSRKANLVEAFFAKKRRCEILHPMDTEGEWRAPLYELEQSYGFPIVGCPVNDATTQRVWMLLAEGFQFREVQQLLNLTRRAFDRIIEGLRSDPAVRLALVHP